MKLLLLSLILLISSLHAGAQESIRKPKGRADFSPRKDANPAAIRKQIIATKGAVPTPAPKKPDPNAKGGSTVIREFRYGSERHGVLEGGDYIDTDFYTDRFSFFGYEGDIIEIVENSSDFDAFLCLYSPNQFICDDNSGGGSNASILVELPETGFYEFHASTLFEFDKGDYFVKIYAFNDAAVVSHDIPAQLAPNQRVSVAITMENTGEVTWSEDMRYRLAAIDDTDPFSDDDRVFLRDGDVVFPGETYTFFTDFVAPATTGNATTDWQMIEEEIEYFGETLEVPVSVSIPSGNNAQFVEARIPTFVQAGQSFPVEITVQNSGSSVWTETAGYKLAAINQTCPIFPDRIGMAPGTVVLAGGSYTFRTLVAAPPNVVIFSDDFEGTDKGWSGTGLWHKVEFGSDYLQYDSPVHSWWYGSEQTGNYDVPQSQRNSGMLLSPEFSIPQNSPAYVAFSSWEWTEFVENADTRRVYVDDAGELTLIAETILDTGTWRRVGPIDISDFAGKTIRLCFEFDTQDEQANDFPGWYVDDIIVSTSPCFVDFQMVREGVEFFGETLPIGIAVGNSYEFDFAAGGGSTLGWQGGVIAGSAVTGVNVAGICMGLPATGDNIAGWVSPERYIELKDSTLYRVRFDAATDQTAPDAIPFLDFIYDNFNSDGTGNNYGGESWFLDVGGGANGIGRANGRTQFDIYITPNAALTPQWQGSLSDGTSGVFTTAADFSNDIRLVVRALDLGSAGINANVDSGTICISALRVDAYPFSVIVPEEELFSLPITTANYLPFAHGQNPEYAVINDGLARVQYILNPVQDRATLFPSLGPEPYEAAELYPVAWESDTLYLVRAAVQLHESSSGTDPLDLISIIIDTATVELGQTHLTTRGGPGNFDRAGSPRKASVAGGPQTYLGFFYGNNRTASPGLDRLRAQVDLMNLPQIAGAGTGHDALEILNLSVDRVALP